mmetsp:Transcript_19695/g.27722  ORF Transcript_19695/g.27722 Transcript_19695/m.27722 type:complete len:292 (+) Transcript_19695:76-951(+)
MISDDLVQRKKHLFQGVLRKRAVEIHNKGDLDSLFAYGIFGKGSLSKSKPMNSSQSELLILSLEEAFFLCSFVHCLEIYRELDEKGDGGMKIELSEIKERQRLNPSDAWKLFCKLEPSFPERYAVYHHFRSRGWIVKSGLKFGADYLLYTDSPEVVHAAYSVIIHTHRWDFDQDQKMIQNDDDFPLDIASLERLTQLSLNAAKKLMICFTSPSKTLASRLQVPYCVTINSTPPIPCTSASVKRKRRNDNDQDNENVNGDKRDTIVRNTLKKKYIEWTISPVIVEKWFPSRR